MSGRPEPGRGRLERAAQRAFAQAPALALATAVQAALLFHLLLTEVPARVVPLAPRLAVAAAIVCLVLVELALLVWLDLLLELAAGRLGGRWLDLAKAATLAALLALSTASVVKYRATGVHLRAADLWFGWHSRRQIVAESLAGEKTALLLLAGATLLLAAAVYALLRRRRAPRPGAAAWLAITLVAAAGGGGLYSSSPVVERFADQLAPEGRWLARRLAARAEPSRAAPPAGEPPGPPIVDYAPAPSPERLNLVLVMLESVPWQRSPFADGSPALAPNLERLAAESLVFSRAYTTSPHSDYAQMAVLSSLHPRKFAHHDYYTRLEYPRTLIWDPLAAAGYATAMFSCQNERWGNMLAYLDTPGLGLLRHSLDWPGARRRGEGTESKVFEETPVAAWRRWLGGLGRRPFFTYLNFQANHFPYQAPPEAPRPFAPWRIDFPASFFSYPPDRVPVMLNRFYNALAYADHHLGLVIAELERLDEWRRTVLVVVSDHGEAFYEHEQPTHGTTLYEEQLRSLMLVRLPGTPGRRIDEPVSLLDLAPALLAGLELPPHGNFQGRGDIFDPGYSAAGRRLFFTIQGVTEEDGVLADGWKYLLNWERGESRLFHLPTDPGELRPRQDAAERAAELDGALREFLGRQLTYYQNAQWRRGYYPPPLP